MKNNDQEWKDWNKYENKMKTVTGKYIYYVIQKTFEKLEKLKQKLL